MTWRRPAAALLAGGMMLTACGSDPGAGGGDSAGRSGDAAEIDAELVNELGEDGITELATSVNTFGFDLHRVLAAEGGNVVTSPLSVSVLLAMMAAGAG